MEDGRCKSVGGSAIYHVPFAMQDAPFSILLVQEQGDDMRTKLRSNQRGAALIEAAVTLPLILLVSVAIFEFGRAYQTWQVLTNAAREGARVAVIQGTTDAQVES